MNAVSKLRGTSQPELYCKYIHRYCNQTRLEGYNYCIRHILEDKAAPFEQCTFVNPPNKKRCTNAAPKTDKRENVLCPFHAKRAMVKVRRRKSKNQKQPLKNVATLLKSLEHYCPSHDTFQKRKAGSANKIVYPVLEAGGGPTSLSDLEFNFNDSLPIEEKARVESVDDDTSFPDKFGEALDNAGVYTHKEILTIAKEKILRLQQLYCEELFYVGFKMLQNKRNLTAELMNLKQRKITSNEPHRQLSEQVDRNSFQALMQHQQGSRAERVLRHRIQRNRKKLKKACAYEKNGIKCKKEVLVSTKFCESHILSDPKQLLFKQCSFGLKVPCKRPVLIFEEDSSCDLHLHRLLKSKVTKQSHTITSADQIEPLQLMDDIASLGFDSVPPGSLFGLDKFGELGESADTVVSEDQANLLQIQSTPAISPTDILGESKKSLSVQKD